VEQKAGAALPDRLAGPVDQRQPPCGAERFARRAGEAVEDAAHPRSVHDATSDGPVRRDDEGVATFAERELCQRHLDRHRTASVDVFGRDPCHRAVDAKPCPEADPPYPAADVDHVERHAVQREPVHRERTLVGRRLAAVPP
jgi:hypothetical protein